MFDENQQVKIVDFGISSSELMPDHNRSSVVVGSPAFISPEQGRGEITDHRTDIYSLGITFYQMLYGRLPFSAKSPQEYLEKHNKAPFPVYESLGGTIPRGAYKIIEKMTQKLPASRYQKYADLIKDLETIRRELYSQKRLKIPAVQNLEPSPSFHGNNFFDALSQIFRNEKSGLLKISWGKLEKEFLILRNEIVHFQSPQKDENIWSELVNKKLMKKEDIPADDEDFEKSLNQLLYLESLNSEDFKNVYREIMLHSLMQVFLWPVTEIRFYQGKIEHDPLARVSTADVLMKAARSIVPFESIQHFVPQEALIIRTPKFEERLKALNLSRDEHFLASRIEGENNSVETLQALTGLSSEQVLRVVYVLERTGLVKYQSASERRQRRIAERSFTPNPAASESPQPVGLKVEEVRKSTQNPERPKDWVDAAPQPDAKLASRNYKQAQSKYKEGSFWEVIRLCGQAIQNNPKDPSYHHLMAMALVNFPHSIRAAVESFRQAIQLDQNNIEYRLQLVSFLREKNQFQEAYRECEKLLLLSPSNKQAAILLRQIELEK